MVVLERLEAVLELAGDEIALCQLVIVVGALGVALVIDLLQLGILDPQFADLEHSGLVPSRF